MTDEPLEINKQKIGSGQPCYVIAEAGVNHNGDVELARQMVKAAAQAGADAVKFQTFTADALATSTAPKADYQKSKTQETENQLEMLRQLELSEGDYPILINECKSSQIHFLSSPFDESSADMLEALGMDAFKIPSGEITNLPYLAYIAKKKKPMILSTGMSFLSEVDVAIRTVYSNGNRKLALLHCTSNYPAPPLSINLRAMNTMGFAFKIPVGYSDHSEGIEIPIAAVAMGACIIEKHFTLDRSLPGPDQAASLEPDEFKKMVSGIRKVEQAIGNGKKEPVESEGEIAAVVRKSIVALKDIPKGVVITDSYLTMKRPGVGLSASMIPHIIGRISKVRIPEGTLISLEMLA